MTAAPAQHRTLSVADLHTEFRTPGGVVRAVDGVTFDLDPGETLGLVGESGSGKSVLVRSIMGLLPERRASVSGRAAYGEIDLLGPARIARALWGREIAMIFQDPMTALNPTKRVGAHLTESMRRHLRLDRREANRRAIELLEQVGIPDPSRRVRQYPHELSGGMRQRVTIAIALACEPNLLIADEPTTALDVTVQQQILDLLGSLQRDRGMSMILVTHDLGVVAGRTKRLAVMYGGQIVEIASTRAVFGRLRHPYTEGLLASIPRIDDRSQTPLVALAGRPPNPAAMPPGCRFEPRCRYATDHCRAAAPALEFDTDHHGVRCWYPRGENHAPSVTIGAAV